MNSQNPQNDADGEALFERIDQSDGFNVQCNEPIEHCLVERRVEVDVLHFLNSFMQTLQPVYRPVYRHFFVATH